MTNLNETININESTEATTDLINKLNLRSMSLQDRLEIVKAILESAEICKDYIELSLLMNDDNPNTEMIRLGGEVIWNNLRAEAAKMEFETVQNELLNFIKAAVDENAEHNDAYDAMIKKYYWALRKMEFTQNDLDITESVFLDYLSDTYTDNEDDETDLTELAAKYYWGHIRKKTAQKKSEVTREASSNDASQNDNTKHCGWNSHAEYYYEKLLRTSPDKRISDLVKDLSPEEIKDLARKMAHRCRNCKN